MAERLARIKNIKDTTANWNSANPVLLSGEIGIEVKSNGEAAFKVGDGVTAWKSLGYVSLTPTELQTEINLKLNSTKWVTDSSHVPYAFDSDCIGTGFYPQGMCKCVFNNKESIAQGYINADGTQQKIVIMDVADGTKYKTKSFTTLGHANSLAWDGTYLYVATGGGTSAVSNIVKLDVNLNVVSTHNISTYAMTYANGKFYALGGSGILYTLDSTMTIKDTKILNVGFRGYTTYQGMACDGEFLYIPNSNWYSASTDKTSQTFGEFIDVYTLSGDFVHTINLNLMFENEEIDFFDGYVLAVVNTGGTANYFKIAVYGNEVGLYKSHSIKEYEMLGIGISNESYDVYVKEDYKGFLMDGSETKPYHNIWIASRYVPNGVKTLKIHLLSDITTNFRIHTTYHKGLAVDIVGNSHTTNQDIYAEGLFTLAIRDLTFAPTGNNITTNAALYIKSVSYAWLNNVTFTGSYNNKKCLYSIASNLTINKVTLNNITNYNGAVLDVTEGGSLTIANLISDSNSYVISNRITQIKYPSINGNNLALIYSGNWDEPFMAFSFYCGVQFDLKLLRRPCQIRVPQSIDILNTPSGATGKPSMVEFKWLTNTVGVITLHYQYSADEVWEGHLDTEANTIEWNMINERFIGENLIPIPYAEITTGGNTYKGVTYKNTNGVINLTGTVQDRFSFRSLNSKTEPLMLERGYYTLSGCPSTDNNVIALCVLKGDTQATETNFNNSIKDIGAGVIIDNTAGNYDDGIRICIVCFGTDTVLNDINVYPMLEKGSIVHSYQPYKLSRQSLRNDIDALMALMNT